jgi:hypothetical protein
VPLLAYIGFHEVLHSTAGRKLDPVNDPAKPGYEANVEPTAVELVGQLDADGGLTALTLLALGRGDAGGNIVFLPVTIQVTIPGATAPQTLAQVYAAGGATALSSATTIMLGFGFDELTMLDDARWAELVGPVAPLGFDSPDRVRVPAFPVGPIMLAATDVGPYLAAQNDSESDLTRLARHDAFWRAWLAAIAASAAPGAVPGETATGIGRFIHTLAAGPVAIDTLPVTATTAVGDVFTVKQDAASALLSSAVPFPTSTVDTPRIRVRLLDGVGASASGLTLAGAAVLVPAGAEVAIVGNADRFGYDTTVVRYNDDADKPAAEALQRAIGLGTVERGNILDDVVAVTIVLGNDFAAQYGSSTDGTSTSPPTST